MEKILVPINFSEASNKALYQAINIAIKRSHLEIILLHGISKISKKEAQSKLEAIVEKYSKNDDVKFQIQIEKEFSPERVAQIVAQNPKITLVVMGTEGKNRIRGFWSNSKTAKVEKLLTCPLMIVPKNIKRHTIQKMAYILSFEKEDLTEIDRVLRFAKPLNAHVECIQMTERDDEEEKHLLEVLAQSYNLPQYQGKITFNSLIYKNSMDTLEEYVQEHQIDMTVFLTEQRNFWENNFGNKLIQKLTLKGKMSLLVLNKDEPKNKK